MFKCKDILSSALQTSYIQNHFIFSNGFYALKQNIRHPKTYSIVTSCGKGNASRKEIALLCKQMWCEACGSIRMVSPSLCVRALLWNFNS